MTDRPIDRWKRATAGAPSRLLKPKYRKPHVARGPEGVAAINSLADACEAWEKACKCGFVLCSERGPCAPVVADPKPSPAPVVERQAHRFVVGQRVRCVEGSRGLARGSEHVIERIDYDSQKQPYLVLENDENLGGWLAQRFEPLTAERGAQESDGWTPPAPWVVEDNRDACLVEMPRFERIVVVRSGDRERGWYTPVKGYLPTLAQACAAALGIRIEPATCTQRDHRFAAIGPDNRSMAAAGADPESCARAAVEAWSAMQREGASHD